MPSSVTNPPTNFSLDPYTGTWTASQASHLLRRALFGPTSQQITDAVANGMDATVAMLLTPKPIDLPISYDTGEGVATYGQPWNLTPYPAGNVEATQTARIKSLGAWLMKRLNNEGNSIHEKLCLFWHNHFAAPLSVDSRSTLKYHQLVHQYALGNFKDFIKEMTINTSMLEFQNGATNSVYSPNENYAREFLELFSIGKGLQSGPGDYSNYTEEDVAAGAKIFTGYVIQGIQSSTDNDVTSVFVPVLHDNTVKQLSYRLNNETVNPAGQNEYANYVDIVFQQDEVARFIARKLYRYFVNHDLTEDIEASIIPAMASVLTANNYEVQPVLEALFKSQHFYDVKLKGSCIKSPLELLFSIVNGTNSSINFDLTTTSDMYLNLYGLGDNLGQSYGQPPSVSGWTAYYQAPSFTKLWVNSTHIKTRMSVAYLFTIGAGLQINGQTFKVNALGFLDGLSNPSNVNSVIDDMILIFTPRLLSTTQRTILKTVLTGGQPDFEWTIQYNDYINNPGDVTYSNPIKLKVETTLMRLLILPECQIF
ncbi:MAG: DUF1800 domain-containing protein [Crocinitomicaceae bacterium]|nr:DUF1800 domain-containing protein [Crocinitomicaceae bacterium]